MKSGLKLGETHAADASFVFPAIPLSGPGLELILLELGKAALFEARFFCCADQTGLCRGHSTNVCRHAFRKLRYFTGCRLGRRLNGQKNCPPLLGVAPEKYIYRSSMSISASSFQTAAASVGTGCTLCSCVCKAIAAGTAGVTVPSGE